MSLHSFEKKKIFREERLAGCAVGDCPQTAERQMLAGHV
jgi:hypothetical protein